jgi:hypothetical protein
MEKPVLQIPRIAKAFTKSLQQLKNGKKAKSQNTRNQ